MRLYVFHSKRGENNDVRNKGIVESLNGLRAAYSKFDYEAIQWLDYSINCEELTQWENRSLPNWPSRPRLHGRYAIVIELCQNTAQAYFKQLSFIITAKRFTNVIEFMLVDGLVNCIYFRERGKILWRYLRTSTTDNI